MKKIIITILLVVLCLGIVGGGIAGIVKLTDTGKLDTKTISSTKFSVGGLDSNGKYMNTNASIYTKEAFECQGLEVSLDFDNEIEYQIYFYDQNNDFVHTTGKLSGAFVKDSVPFFAKYARIVVTPKNDEVVSTLEVLKYAGQLTVKVNREQGFKNYTENLLEVDKKFCFLNASTGAEETSEDEVKVVSKFINISSYDDSLIFRADSVLSGSGNVYFYSSDKSFVGKVTFDDWASVVFTSSNSVLYYGCSFSDLPFSATYMRFAYGSNAPFEVVCR